MKKTHDDRYLPKNPRYRKMLENESESRSLYSDAWKRLKKDKAAMIGLCMIAVHPSGDRGALYPRAGPRSH